MKIKTPTLLIDRSIVLQNIDRMIKKAIDSNVIFRPHFKTHQSEAIGEIFRSKGIEKITVSSVSMASFFAEKGWKDITIAFPLNILEMEQVNQLASAIQLNVLIESEYVASFLQKNAKYKMGVFIKIDSGFHRTGLQMQENHRIDFILNMLKGSPLLYFKGFLTHAGHAYHARGKNEILEIKENAAEGLQILKQKYKMQYPDLLLSFGDTPSCSLADDCAEFDEIRPGNFVYYDVMQYHLGSCRLEDIAVLAACPVVAVHPQREEVVIYGGAVHLSREFIEADDGFKLFGYVVLLDENGKWQSPVPGAYVSSLSQEHGIVKMPKSFLKQTREGSVLGILPIHSCLTANLIKLQILV